MIFQKLCSYLPQLNFKFIVIGYELEQISLHSVDFDCSYRIRCCNAFRLRFPLEFFW